MEQDMSRKKKAYWEVEITVPMSNKDGDPSYYQIGRELIEGVGNCHSSGVSFGWGDDVDDVADAVGDADFDTYEEALQWKTDTQETLDEEFPEEHYNVKPKVFCGVWVHSKEDDEEGRDYYEIIGNGTFGGYNDGDTITYNELDIQKS